MALCSRPDPRASDPLILREGPSALQTRSVATAPSPVVPIPRFVPLNALWSLPSPTHPRTPLFLAYPTSRHLSSQYRPALSPGS